MKWDVSKDHMHLPYNRDDDMKVEGSDLVNVTGYLDISNRKLDRSVAGFDVSRKLVLLGVWDMPFLRSSKSLTAKLAGGWQLSGTGMFQSGNPMTVNSSAPWPRGDFNADGVAGDRPNAPAAGVKQSGWARSGFQSGIFSVTDFPLPAPGVNGNLGRNRFRGPGYAQVDLSLSKKFPITERVAAQLRLDAFNALNRVNLNNPVLDLVNNNFGKSTSALTPKSYQLGLRILF